MPRRLILLIALPFVAAASSRADSVGSSEADKRPSLEELKVHGAKSSSYLRAQSGVVPQAPSGGDLNAFKQSIAPILSDACVDCHGPYGAEASLRVDKLDPDLLNGGDADWWTEILTVLNNREMPPPDEGEISDEDRAKVVEWLSNELRFASQARRASGAHSAFRRLTKYEYNYALQDLLGLPWNFARDLPPEAISPDGFQNSSEMLHVSVTQLETYRDLARTALKRAALQGDRPKVFYWSVTMQEAAERELSLIDKKKKRFERQFANDPQALEKHLARLSPSDASTRRAAHFRNLTTGGVLRATWEYANAKYAFAPADEPRPLPQAIEQIAVLPGGEEQSLTVELGQAVPDEGSLRVRVLASRARGATDAPPSLRLEFGWQATNEGRAITRLSIADTPITASPNAPEVYEWSAPLGEVYPRNAERKVSKMGGFPSPSEFVRLINSTAARPDAESGEVRIYAVEVAAPLYEQWPPRSHAALFFESDRAEDELAYAREIFSSFMPRAWRRGVDAAEIDRKVELFQAIRSESDGFEDAVVEVLATVLTSPDFLFVRNTPRERDPTEQQTGNTVGPKGPAAKMLPGHELATRLSLFLWCSVPDERLLALADSGELQDLGVLSEEVDRMLSHPRSSRFAEHFVHQWLDMQLLDYLAVDKSIQGFDPALKEAMQREPIEFFREVLRKDSSVLDFIHSSYAMVNERLAQHYGVTGVYGNHFRRVAIEPDLRRGGILTQAGLLAMNSDGKDSHPLKRGVWMLKSVLNRPPAPAAAGVPEIDLTDPEIAKLTLKQRIEDHRNHAACMSCHKKIDPWGIVFENYDAIGRWREEVAGQPVDASSELVSQERLEGMDGLKRFLLSDRQDQFVRATIEKLATFALGRPLAFSDRAEVDEITKQARQNGDGLATIVKCLVRSPMFRSR